MSSRSALVNSPLPFRLSQNGAGMLPVNVVLIHVLAASSNALFPMHCSMIPGVTSRPTSMWECRLALAVLSKTEKNERTRPNIPHSAMWYGRLWRQWRRAFRRNRYSNIPFNILSYIRPVCPGLFAASFDLSCMLGSCTYTCISLFGICALISARSSVSDGLTVRNSDGRPKKHMIALAIPCAAFFSVEEYFSSRFPMRTFLSMYLIVFRASSDSGFCAHRFIRPGVVGC